ncbi:MAG: hypothetical protein QNJ04_06490 [Desulfobacterales bacterium]|nr:hypothetical protein [Desulfobacterales bacterium]
MPLSVYAPGKLVLLGEYAVLEGAPAIVAAVDRRVRVEIAPRNEISRLDIPHLGLAGIPLDGPGDNREAPQWTADQIRQLRFVRSIVASFRRMVDFGRTAPPPMALTVDARPLFSERGVKLGLGSSAALTVALIAGLYAHIRGQRPERPELFKYALAVHRHLQGGVGSGVDVAASVYGGFTLFQRPIADGDQQPRIQPVSWPPGLQIMAVWTGKPASTTRLFTDLEAFRLAKSDYFQTKMTQLRDTAFQGTQAFKRGDAQGFINAADNHYRLLAQLTLRSDVPIVTADDEHLAATARNGGGVYKPSGAGGGDVGLVLADAQSDMGAIHRSIADGGYEILNLQWGAEGVSL